MGCGLAVLVSGCGGGGGDGGAKVADGKAAAAASLATVPRGTLLQTTWSAYPRMVRLSHQRDPSRNGRIVASVSEFERGALQVGFHASDDGGATFRRLSTLQDAGFAAGLCCGSLYELPRAVGALPAGVLLFSVSVGHERAGTTMTQPIYRSDDGGASFRPLSASCGTAARVREPGRPGTGVWEPEFYVAADGSLVCVYSDETTPSGSQVLQLTRTEDGIVWSEPRVIVAGMHADDRPGMAVVRRLPDGRYLMSFELCGPAVPACVARLLVSSDGLDWGPPAGMGMRPQTALGQFFRHAPTIAWAPGSPGTPGVLTLIGQLLSDGSGTGIDPASGRALLVSDSGQPTGPWRIAPAPIGLAASPRESNYCQNYSTALLPSEDGQQLLALQTDLDAQGGCQARFGVSVLSR